MEPVISKVCRSKERLNGTLIPKRWTAGWSGLLTIKVKSRLARRMKCLVTSELALIGRPPSFSWGYKLTAIVKSLRAPEYGLNG